MKLRVKLLYADAKLPERANPDDSGADVFAHNVKRIYTHGDDWGEEKCIEPETSTFPLILQPGERALIGTGIAATVGTGYEIQARSRSGVALKQGMIIGNSPGTIDASYRGEIGIILVNNSLGRQTIEKGNKIAQLVVAKVECCEIEKVENLPETNRGAGGFGSTGK